MQQNANKMTKTEIVISGESEDEAWIVMLVGKEVYYTEPGISTQMNLKWIGYMQRNNDI